jgi:hypothetical protein
LRTDQVLNPAWLYGVSAAIWIFGPAVLRGLPYPGFDLSARLTAEYMGTPFCLLSVLLAIEIFRVRPRSLAWTSAWAWFLTTLSAVVPWWLLDLGSLGMGRAKVVLAFMAAPLVIAAVTFGAISLRSVGGRDGWHTGVVPRGLHALSLLALSGLLLKIASDIFFKHFIVGSFAGVIDAYAFRSAVGFACAIGLALALLGRSITARRERVVQQADEPAKAQGS